jgi:uncharacterized protein (TIGR02145 family)
MTEGGTICGSLANRRKMSTYADFTQPSTNTQVYTFIPDGTASDIRFTYIESLPNIVESVSAPVTNSGYTVVTVRFNSNLNTMAIGRTSNNPLTVDLYALYGAPSSCHYVKLRIKIQDCQLCGARTVANTWLSFLCYNLGASENMSMVEQMSYRPISAADPTVYGDLYQWGRATDGHQSRLSQPLPIYATTDTPNHPYFITSSKYEYDWRVNGNTITTSFFRWNGTIKAVNDPCPPGWKVPSQTQWNSIFRVGDSPGAPSKASANTWTWNSSGTPGFKVGDALFLPAGGYRDKNSAATLKYVGTMGRYWSSTWANSSLGNGYLVEFKKSSVDPANHGYVARGGSVRCVEE